MFEGFDGVYVIFAIAALYYIGSQFVLNKLVDKEKIKKIQAESKRLQKEMSEATKANDEKRLSEISAEYEKFMHKMMEMSFMQLKPLIIIIPALMILTPFLTHNFKGFEIILPFPLPVIYDGFPKLFSLDINGFLSGFPYWRNLFGPRGWFWVSVIGTSVSVSLIRAIYNKIKSSINPDVSSALKQGEAEENQSSKPDLNTGLSEDESKVEDEKKN